MQAPDQSSQEFSVTEDLNLSDPDEQLLRDLEESFAYSQMPSDIDLCNYEEEEKKRLESTPQESSLSKPDFSSTFTEETEPKPLNLHFPQVKLLKPSFKRCLKIAKKYGCCLSDKSKKDNADKLVISAIRKRNYKGNFLNFHAAASYYKHRDCFNFAKLCYQFTEQIYQKLGSPQKNPEKEAMCIYSLGEIAYYEGNYEKAVEYFQKPDPENPRAFWGAYHLGLVYYKQQNFNMALKEFEKSIGLINHKLKFLEKELKSEKDIKYWDEHLRQCLGYIREQKRRLESDKTSHDSSNYLLKEIENK